MGGMWAPYVPVAKRQQQAAREVAKLRKAGRIITGVTIEGRTIVRTFWGKAWCDNLESYRDYESRLPRGRTYVRNGSVIDLQINPLKITALVSGSEIYTISITIAALSKAAWQALCQDCAGSIDSLVELLQGRFSEGVMARLCRQDGGLFPKPADIKFRCSCPDSASMCKHVAAALYGVGARLDAEPELLFRLRAVDAGDLVAKIDASLPLSKVAPAADKVLASEDLSALFGLELAPAEAPVSPPATAAAKAATVTPVAVVPVTQVQAATPPPAQAAPRRRGATQTVPEKARSPKGSPTRASIEARLKRAEAARERAAKAASRLGRALEPASIAPPVVKFQGRNDVPLPPPVRYLTVEEALARSKATTPGAVTPPASMPRGKARKAKAEA